LKKGQQWNWTSWIWGSNVFGAWRCCKRFEMVSSVSRRFLPSVVPPLYTCGCFRVGFPQQLELEFRTELRVELRPATERFRLRWCAFTFCPPPPLNSTTVTLLTTAIHINTLPLFCLCLLVLSFASPRWGWGCRQWYTRTTR
jgi:hypothetical protein